MKRSTAPTSYIRVVFLCIFLFGVSACGMIPKGPERDYERLNKIIKLYNNEFESKSDAAGSMWVKDGLRADYLKDVKDFYEKIDFVNSQIISISFKNLGKLVSKKGSNPGTDFDEALVTYRYEYIISPSFSVRTKILTQRWVLEPGGVWKLIPDLSSFYE